MSGRLPYAPNRNEDDDDGEGGNPPWERSPEEELDFNNERGRDLFDERDDEDDRDIWDEDNLDEYDDDLEYV